MQPNLKTSSAPKKRLRAVVGGVLTAAMLLSVPVLSASTLASWGRTATTPPVIEKADDAVTNGFHIVKKENAGVVRSNSRAAFADQPADTVLREWRYTRSKSGSPGN